MPDPIDLERALEPVTEYWSPKVVARVNDHYVKVAKLSGTFTWHKHDDEDELFLVLRGKLRIQLEGDREVTIAPGELFVVPRGVRHNPIADEECWIALVEPVETKHTGDVVTPQTRSIEEQLAGS